MRVSAPLPAPGQRPPARHRPGPLPARCWPASATATRVRRAQPGWRSGSAAPPAQRCNGPDRAPAPPGCVAASCGRAGAAPRARPAARPGPARDRPLANHRRRGRSAPGHARPARSRHGGRQSRGRYPSPIRASAAPPLASGPGATPGCRAGRWHRPGPWRIRRRAARKRHAPCGPAPGRGSGHWRPAPGWPVAPGSCCAPARLLAHGRPAARRLR